MSKVRAPLPAHLAREILARVSARLAAEPAVRFAFVFGWWSATPTSAGAGRSVDPDLVFGALDEVGDLEAFAAATAAQLPRPGAP